MPYGTLNGQVNAAVTTFSSTATTTSTSTVSSGYGVSIGANYTGRFLVIVILRGSHSVVDNASNFGLFRTTGAIPTNGSATTGNAIGGTQQLVSAAAATEQTIPLLILDPNAGIGTFNYYIAYSSATAGTTTLNGAQTTMVIIEI